MFFFFFGRTMWHEGILVPQPGIKPAPPAVEARSFNHWTAREVPKFMLLKRIIQDFPGGPAVKTSPSNAGGVGSIPGWGANIPHASQPKKPKHKTEAVL